MDPYQGQQSFPHETHRPGWWQPAATPAATRALASAAAAPYHSPMSSHEIVRLTALSHGAG